MIEVQRENQIRLMWLTASRNVTRFVQEKLDILKRSLLDSKRALPNNLQSATVYYSKGAFLQDDLDQELDQDQ